jgi:hypothetical protein
MQGHRVAGRWIAIVAGTFALAFLVWWNWSGVGAEALAILPWQAWLIILAVACLAMVIWLFRSFLSLKGCTKRHAYLVSRRLSIKWIIAI